MNLTLPVGVGPTDVTVAVRREPGRRDELLLVTRRAGLVLLHLLKKLVNQAHIHAVDAVNHSIAGDNVRLGKPAVVDQNHSGFRLDRQFPSIEGSHLRPMEYSLASESAGDDVAVQEQRQVVVLWRSQRKQRRSQARRW